MNAAYTETCQMLWPELVEYATSTRGCAPPRWCISVSHAAFCRLLKVKLRDAALPSIWHFIFALYGLHCGLHRGLRLLQRGHRRRLAGRGDAHRLWQGARRQPRRGDWPPRRRRRQRRGHRRGCRCGHLRRGGLLERVGGGIYHLLLSLESRLALQRRADDGRC